METKIIMVNEYIGDLENWTRLYNYMDRILEEVICTPGWRDLSVWFKISNGLMSNVHKLTIREFITQWVMWRPYAVFRGYLKETDFERKTIEFIDNNKIASYCDRHYIRNKSLRNKDGSKITSHQKNKETSIIIEYFGKMMSKYGDLQAIGTSILDVVDVMNKSEEFCDLMNYEAPVIQQKEIEQDIEQKGKRVLELLGQHNEQFRTLIESGVLKKDQAIKYYFAIGFQADLSGKTIPHVIKSSYLNRGMQSVSDYAVDLFTANKSLAVNKTSTGKAGYQERKLEINSNLTRLYDKSCSGEGYINYKIKSKNELLMASSMNIITDNDSLHVIDKDYDEYLIGTTVKLKNPLTCSNKVNIMGKDGRLHEHVVGVCKDCYGDLYETNKGIHVGQIAAMECGSDVTQKQLSSKHSLTVDSQVIELMINDKEATDDMIYMDKTEIMINPTAINNKYPINLRFIDEGNNNEDYDDEEPDDEENMNKRNKSDVLMDKDPSFNKIILTYTNIDNKKITKVIETKDALPIFFMSPSLFNYVISEIISEENEVHFSIGISEEDEDIDLSTIDIRSRELSLGLLKLNNIFENKKAKHEGRLLNRNDIDEYVEILSDIMIEAGFNRECMLLHTLIVLRQCVRSIDNIVECVDFSNPNSRYEILTISESIMNAPTKYQRLKFERIKTEYLNNPSLLEITSGDPIDKILYPRLIM